MRPGLRPNAGGTVPAYETARHRRKFRVEIAPFMSNGGLHAEINEMAARIRWIRDGNSSVMRTGELLARLRALRHEAISRGMPVSAEEIPPLPDLWEGAKS